MGEEIYPSTKSMRLLVDKVSDHPGLLDTSELLRPEAILKEKEAFRDYTKNDALGERVKRTYTEMHTKQVSNPKKIFFRSFRNPPDRRPYQTSSLVGREIRIFDFFAKKGNKLLSNLLRPSACLF